MKIKAKIYNPDAPCKWFDIDTAYYDEHVCNKWGYRKHHANCDNCSNKETKDSKNVIIDIDDEELKIIIELFKEGKKTSRGVMGT